MLSLQLRNNNNNHLHWRRRHSRASPMLLNWPFAVLATVVCLRQFCLVVFEHFLSIATVVATSCAAAATAADASTQESIDCDHCFQRKITQSNVKLPKVTENCRKGERELTRADKEKR